MMVIWPWYPSPHAWTVMLGDKPLTIQGWTWRQHDEYSWTHSAKKKQFEEFFKGLRK